MTASPTMRPNAGRESEPGYYLISNGRGAFEKECRCRVPLKTWLFRLNSDLGVMSYVAMIGIVTALILALALLCVAYAGVDGWSLFLLAIVGFVPASDVAVAVVNRAITEQIGASMLPGLELRDGVPPDLATIVVVPTLLTTPSAIEEQIEKLEVHHLSNPDANLRFALLSDWKDSDAERSADDDKLLDVAVAGIARLNERYGATLESPLFFLLHRRRIWNDGEGKWMGWERKRGKLHELNRLLRGATDTTFIALDGRAPRLPVGIRYVITLDADTRLPIGTAQASWWKDRAPAQPASLRPSSRSCCAGPCHPSAAGDPVAAHGPRWIAIPARLFRTQRSRSLRARRFGRVPGSLRRGLLLRQGNL